MKNLLVVACLLLVHSVYGQVKVTRFTVPFEGSVNMSQVDDKYNAQIVSMEMPEPDESAEWEKLQQVKQESARRFPRRRGQSPEYKTSTVQAPVVGISYVADSFAGIPPDNYMAINKWNRTVSVVNSMITVHDALSGQILSRKILKSFSSKVNLQTLDMYRFDPKIIYDPEADRFICVMLNGPTQPSYKNYIVLGFSKTSDPTGAWNFYKLTGDYASDGTWFDYPAIAITHDELFITGNKILGGVWQTGFQQSIIYQIRKKDGYDSLSLNVQLWENIKYNNQSIRNLHPVKGGGNLKGPQQYFLSNRNFDIQNDTIFLIKVPDTIGSGNLNLTVTALKSNLQYGVPPNGEQPDTTTDLATNDGRVLGAFAEGGEIQFVSTTIHPQSGSSAIYHGKISAYATNPSLQADYYKIDTLDFGYPNISFCGHNGTAISSIISFNYTGRGKYAGMGAICYDGTQYSDMTDIKTGVNSIRVIQDTLQRWGDYTGSQPDWNALGTVWVEGIFGRADKDYGNYMAKLVSPFTSDIKSPAMTVAESSVFPNPALEYIKFQFDLNDEQELGFAIYSMDGKKVDEILRQQCERGKNRIQFNIASLAPGTYFLKAITQNGSPVMTQKFIKR